MKRTRPNQPGRFLEQFNHFNDAVLRRVQFQFLPSEFACRAQVTLSALQASARKFKNGWVNVRLAIRGVEEFALRENTKESSRVLSSGLHIEQLSGLLFFDFAPYSVSPRGLEDYRRSGFYIAGRSFTFKIEEYSEQVSTKRKKA